MFTFLAGLLATFALVGCGNSAQPGSPTLEPTTATAQATQPASVNQPTATTAGSQPITTAAPTASNASNISDACAAFGAASGFGGLPTGYANIVSQAQGGPSVQASYSQNAPSSEAREISEFFEEALSEALGGEVSAECYWEARATEGAEYGQAWWVALRLPGQPLPDALQQIQTSLVSKGAEVGGVMSTPQGGEYSGMVIVSGLPLEQEGESSAMLMMSNQFAILIAGRSQESGEEPTPDADTPEGSGARSPEPTDTQAAPQVAASVQDIESQLKSDVETALGVSVTTDGSIHSTSGNQSSFFITFNIPEGSELPSDVGTRLENGVKARQGVIEGTLTIQQAVFVNFSAMEIAGVKAQGSLTLVEEHTSVVASLVY